MKKVGERIRKFFIHLLGGYCDYEYSAIISEIEDLAKSSEEKFRVMEDMAVKLSNDIDTEIDKRERAERDYNIEHEHVAKLMMSEAEMKLQLERIPTAERVAEAAKAHTFELGHEIERLTEENTRLQLELEMSKGGDALYLYSKSLQSQLHEVMDKTEAFGFPHSNPIPGSVSVAVDDMDVGGSEITVVRTRAIAPDYITAAISEASDMGDKLSLMINYMKSSGSFGRILEKLLKSGAISLTLAYNPNCTSYELYTEMACRVYSGDAILTVERGDIKEPNEYDSAGTLTTDELLKQLNQ